MKTKPKGKYTQSDAARVMKRAEEIVKEKFASEVGSFRDRRARLQARADEYNSRLLADDQRFNRTAHVVHEDGSTFIVQNAFLMEAEEGEDEFVVLFAEHHSPQVFAQDDLEAWAQYERVTKDVEFLK